MYHREYMFFRLNQTLHKYRPIAPIFQELLHLLWKVLHRLTPDGVHAHGLSEENKVRVRHRGVRVSGLVEEI